MGSRANIARLCAAIAATFLAASIAQAQEFPTRGVRIIVPFPPGSSLDWSARILGENLSRMWGQSVIVENISGAGGNIGTQRFARSDPDGHTLLASPPGPVLLNKMLYKDTKFDAEKFVPVSLITTHPNVLVVRNDLPVKTFKEYVDYARANPGKMNYASQGAGSTGLMTARWLEIRANIKMLHVPYRGGAAILADLAAGHVDSFFDAAPTSLPLHLGGKARIIAVAGAERLPSIADIPIIADAIPGFVSGSFSVIMAPEKTPMPIAEKISADLAKLLNDPAIGNKFRALQMTPVAANPERTKTLLAKELALWTKIIKDIELAPQ